MFPKELRRRKSACQKEPEESLKGEEGGSGEHWMEEGEGGIGDM